jgi:hypothetical protein
MIVLRRDALPLVSSGPNGCDFPCLAASLAIWSVSLPRLFYALVFAEAVKHFLQLEIR